MWPLGNKSIVLGHLYVADSVLGTAEWEKNKHDTYSERSVAGGRKQHGSQLWQYRTDQPSDCLHKVRL